LKDTDTRADKYREQFGNLAVELDALSPATLESIVKDSIRETLDLSQFEEEREEQAEEARELATLRSHVLELVDTIG
jgi:hypothetical protein